MNRLDPLFTPQSIALVGASPHRESPGGIVLDNLGRFPGRLYPVNPRCAELAGAPCYPSPAALPEPVDLAVILRPAAEVPAILAELAGRAACAVVVSAGFAEVGRSELQEELVAAARNAGIRLLGPNCLGVYNPWRRLDTLFLPRERLPRPRRGNVAVVSQSGAVLVSFLDALAGMGCGVSLAANYGNAADIDVPELYDYLAADSRTDLVVSYLESVGDGRRFLAAATALNRMKPLLLLKAGKGAGGQRAAFSHTGRLAGRYEVFSSLLRQAGIPEIGSYDRLLEAVRALSRQRPAGGNRVAIVTNAGGFGVLATDESLRLGLDPAPLPEELAAQLHRVFPPFYAVGNPLDLTGQVSDDDYRLALAHLADRYDGFLVIALAGVAGITPRLAGILTDFHHTCGKPVVATIGQGRLAPLLTRRIERAGIPVYATPEGGMRGLGTLLGGAP